MTRWFTALLYALMLACVALPVHAAAAAGGPALVSVATVSADGESQDTGEQGVLSVDASDPRPSSKDGNTPEVPELFFDALPRLTLPLLAAEMPLSIAVPLSPHPFLKGLQRPPRRAL